MFGSLSKCLAKAALTSVYWCSVQFSGHWTGSFVLRLASANVSLVESAQGSPLRYVDSEGPAIAPRQQHTVGDTRVSEFATYWGLR